MDRTTYYRLANVPNRLQSCHPEWCVALVVHETEQDLDKITPLADREFYRSNGGHKLRGDLAHARIWGRECLHGLLFDLCPHACVECKPSVRVLLLPGCVLETVRQSLGQWW